ncbi:hypothetical protein EMIT0111MI5_130153 [Burkholderia sp. IT-111MI5]
MADGCARLRFRDGRARPIAAPGLAARDRAGVSEASYTRDIMAAAVYTTSSSPPIRHPHGTLRGTRLGAGDGLANEPASAGPQLRQARPVPFERSVAAACPTAAARPPGCRTRNQRPVGRFHA